MLRGGATATLLLLVALVGDGRADEPATVARSAARKPAPGKFLLHVNFGFNVYTYLGATAKAPETHVTPAQRIILGQQVGGAWFFHPSFRLQLTLQFGETLSGVPPGSGGLTLIGVIPWVVFQHKGFFFGAGPFLMPRAHARDEFEVGLFVGTGYAFQLGGGVSFALAVQIPATFLRRFTAQITPLVSFGYRF